MSVQKPPSHGDRGGGNNHTVRMLGVAERRRREYPAPELKDGQVRCPVCRRGASPRRDGFLRSHRDQFGNPCLNHSTGERVHLDVLPPVVFDEEA